MERAIFFNYMIIHFVIPCWAQVIGARDSGSDHIDPWVDRFRYSPKIGKGKKKSPSSQENVASIITQITRTRYIQPKKISKVLLLSHFKFQPQIMKLPANINPRQNYYGHPLHCLSLDSLKRPIKLNLDTHILSKLDTSTGWPVDPFRSLSWSTCTTEQVPNSQLSLAHTSSKGILITL